MTAQIGYDGPDLRGASRPDLLRDLAGVHPEPGDEWVRQEGRLGFRSTQRLWIGDVPGGVAVATWPTELARQAGCPASMVGVNGAHISNLNPPTLAAVSFGIAQCGLALLRDRLTRLMRRPLAWTGIALINLSAMTLFLWHQTAFVTVSSIGLLAGRVPGLLTAPTGGLWVAERLIWLPVFAITLSGLRLALRRVERGPRTVQA
jgi:hypothetical protein